MNAKRVRACLVSSTLAGVCFSGCATTVAPPTPQQVTPTRTVQPAHPEVILFPLWSLLPRQAAIWDQSSVPPPWIKSAPANPHSRKRTLASVSEAGTASAGRIIFPLWSLAPQYSQPWAITPSRLKPTPQAALRRSRTSHTKNLRRVRTSLGKKQRGVASWYGPGFHGRQTANGEIYDQYQLTAAHRTLPLGTWVAVKNPTNGKMIEVRINDRGPYIDGRIIDLSYAAAQALNMIKPGITQVEVEIIAP
jgi:rare lipoprotein A (peptidoglycan hydrolase)